MENETKLWNKTAAEVTVGDQMKITLGIVAVCALPWVASEINDGARKLAGKFQARRAAKKAAKEQ